MTLDIRQGAVGAPGDIGHTTRRLFPLYTGPASYVAGGDPGLLAALGIGKLFAVDLLALTNGTKLYLGVYTFAGVGAQTADAIQVFDPTTGAEVAPGTNLSTYTAQFEVIGQ